MRYTVLWVVGVLLFSSCALLQKTVAPQPLSFDTVRADLTACEKSGSPAVCEGKARDYLRTPWPAPQEGELRYYLLRFLAAQDKHDRVLTLLKDLPEKAPYLREARRIGALSAFASGDYGTALDLSLLIYLSLATDQKPAMSRIVFLSYLYGGDTVKAARWFSKLNAAKRELVHKELAAYLAARPEVAAAFAKALASFERPEGETPAAPAVADAGTVTPPPSEGEGEALPEMAPKVEEEPVADQFDGSYRPDWGKVCLFLSDEEKWRKVNEVVEIFFEWFLSERQKGAIKLTTLHYLDAAELEPLFAAARKEGCFAGIGPLFSDVAADRFAQLSAATPLPLFGFTGWSGQNGGLLFNLKYTKEREAIDLISWLTGRGKRRFAIAYPDDLKGRAQRDLYWSVIENAGGTVSDALAFGPGDKALLDDVDEILVLPEGYNATLYRFRQENKSRYPTLSLMKRALDRIEKVTPMQADFEVLVMLGSPDQTAMLLPAFPYKNVEFDYYSNSEKHRVRTNQRKLREDFNLPWEINTVLFAAPSEVKIDASFERKVDKLIDGMVVAAPWQDIGDQNAAWKGFLEIFTAKFEREPYAIEQTLAEIGTVLLAAREKGGMAEIAPFVQAVRSLEFPLLAAGRTFRFSAQGSPAGIGEIFVGVKTKGFQPARELFKDEEDGGKKKEQDGEAREGEKEEATDRAAEAATR